MPIWAQVIVWAAAVITAVTVILGFLIKAFKLIDKITDSWTKVNRIVAAVEPNNGKSLFDRVTQAEQRLAENTIVLSQIQRDIESVLIERPRSPNVIRAEVDEIDGTPI